MTGNRNPSSQQISNVIQQKLQAGLGRKVDEIVTVLNKMMRAQQEQFFTILAQKIIGAKGPPDLGSYTPDWAPLTKRYRDYRYKKKKIARYKFFEFNSRNSESGKPSLATLLKSAKSSTVFGAPLVYKDKLATDRRKSAITIRLFPKVVETLASEQIDEKKYFNSRNRAIAWRLRNFQGTRLRPIMREYMLWWINIRVKDIVKRAIR